MEHEKILAFTDCAETFRRLRAEGKRIVQCHGTFDLLHPGHVKHLAEAKEHGEVLVVSITSAPFVNKGPGRPVFSDEQRAFQLAHLGIVDYVVVVPKPAAVEVIDVVRPHVYCKGTEYSNPQNETDRRIDEDAEAVRAHGGEVVFVGEPLHSSTKLLGLHFDSLDPEVREYLGTIPPVADTIDAVCEQIRELRVLVVGDLIIDRYAYCRVQGLTSKSRVLAVRPVKREDHMGGSLAIARHLASFGCATRLVALAGKEPWLAPLTSRCAKEGLELALVQDAEYPTIVKERYVERYGVRKDLTKHFAVDHLRDAPSDAHRERLLETLREELEGCDMVVLCDYGHGLVDERVQALLEEKAPYLALNCQTNSYNYGYNLITKYRRCDLFALDEGELGLAYRRRGVSEFELLTRLAGDLRADQGWLTLGSSGSVVWTKGEETHRCPAMTRSTIDTVGAGDAFFAVAALCGKVGAPIPLASVLSNLAGAFAANIVGNLEPISQEAVVKNARYLLKSAQKGSA